MDLGTPEQRDSDCDKRYISVIDHIITNDDNMSYPVVLYRLAKRCLQLER